MCSKLWLLCCHSQFSDIQFLHDKQFIIFSGYIRAMTNLAFFQGRYFILPLSPIQLLQPPNVDLILYLAFSQKGIEFYLFVSDGGMNDRGSTCKFRNARSPALDGSGRKTTTLVRDHEYFIPTKFHHNLSSGSWEEVENVKVYGRSAMTIAHWSLWLRWAKNGCQNFFYVYRSRKH